MSALPEASGPPRLFARGALLTLPLPFVAWSLFSLARGQLRWEIIALLVVAPALAWATPRTRRLLVAIYPLGLVGLLYDAMRFVADVGVTPARVHVCDLHAFDAAVFGVGDAAHRLSLPEYFQLHARPVLDALGAVPYGTFIYVEIAFTVYLFFRDKVALKRFAWSFFFLNVAGFFTYHLYPAAPPWYFATYGCHVDLAAHANEGPNLARVDGWLHFGYFHGFYGRASDVFGAVPSLHVAYPLLIVLEEVRRGRWPGRTLAAVFWTWMCCSAVYLCHHWVTDVLVGNLYALAVYGAVTLALSRTGAHEGRVATARVGPDQGLARSG